MPTDLYLGKACAGEPTWVPFAAEQLVPGGAGNDDVIIAQEGVVPGEAERADRRFRARDRRD